MSMRISNYVNSATTTNKNQQNQKPAFGGVLETKFGRKASRIIQKISDGEIGDKLMLTQIGVLIENTEKIVARDGYNGKATLRISEVNLSQKKMPQGETVHRADLVASFAYTLRNNTKRKLNIPIAGDTHFRHNDNNISYIPYLSPHCLNKTIAEITYEAASSAPKMTPEEKVLAAIKK